MTIESIEVERPDRWTHPLSAEMDDSTVKGLMTRPPFALMDRKRFASNAALSDILKNDTRLLTFEPGDFVFHEGQYGGTAYLVLSGNIRIILARLVPCEQRGARRAWSGMQWLDFFKSSQAKKSAKNCSKRGRSNVETTLGYRGEGTQTRVYLQDVPGVIEANATSQVTPGEMFGELAAVTRSPREFTAVAETECQVLEIRWQGLKLLQQDPRFRELLDDRYRQDLLRGQLSDMPEFQFIPDVSLDRIVEAAKLETFGNLEWFADFRKRSVKSANEQIAAEPLIAEEGSFAAGLWIVRGGFARLSRRQGAGHRTLAYLGKGQMFGFRELAHNYRTGAGSPPLPYQESLRAIGYVDAVCIPKAEVLEHILPFIRKSDMPSPITQARYQFGQPVVDAPLDFGSNDVETGLLEFLVDKRLMNGREAMVIDMDRCTRCDDCVRACGATHGGMPVFERRGPQYGNWMFAHSCMHCEDPVCMIGCPTGAIHRNHATGLVDINPQTCIGCKSCAESCPYNNIKMIQATDGTGRAKVDQTTGLPILQASKCDFCSSGNGQPACQTACPHDALFRMDLSNVSEIQANMGGKPNG